MIEIPSMIIVLRAVFHENNKYCSQLHQKSAIFITTGIFLKKDLSCNHMYAIDVMIY